MNTTTDKQHDEIANLAQQLWRTEGCQPGRDEEYWLKAERQILAGTQQATGQPKNAGVKFKDASSIGRSSARV